MARIPDSCGVSIKTDRVNKHACTVFKRIALLDEECQNANHECDIDADTVNVISPHSCKDKQNNFLCQLYYH